MTGETQALFMSVYRTLKLRCRYAVIRTGLEGSKNWLLIKMKHDHARREGDVIEEEPRSAKTGRTLEDIAAEEGS